MSAAEPRTRFEPPPWEQEAFERFRREQAEAAASDELSLEADVEVVPATPPAGEGAVSEETVAAMITELRAAESGNRRVSPHLGRAVSIALALGGTAGVVGAARLFAGVRGASGSALLLAAVASLMVLMISAAFIAVAVVLFRKYRQ